MYLERMCLYWKSRALFSQHNIVSQLRATQWRLVAKLSHLCCQCTGDIIVWHQPLNNWKLVESWWHRAITWIDTGFSSVRSCGIQMRTVSMQMFNWLINQTLKWDWKLHILNFITLWGHWVKMAMAMTVINTTTILVPCHEIKSLQLFLSQEVIGKSS